MRYIIENEFKGTRSSSDVPIKRYKTVVFFGRPVHFYIGVGKEETATEGETSVFYSNSNYNSEDDILYCTERVFDIIKSSPRGGLAELKSALGKPNCRITSLGIPIDTGVFSRDLYERGFKND